MAREIKLRDNEDVASMCPLPGTPNAYMVMTTHGRLWEIRVTKTEWSATRLRSESDLELGPLHSGLV